MSKRLTVSDSAYAALAAQRGPNESFSDVILRLAPPPLETCGDLLDYLERTKAPLLDLNFLAELRKRKRNSRGSAA